MAGLLLALVLLLGGFLLYITLSDYQPQPLETLLEKTNVPVVEQDTFKFINWNIGYAGLGKEMDFFYDEGTKVRPEKLMSRKYLDGIKAFVTANDTVDFWMLQEVDIKSKRSYRMNEVAEIEAAKAGSIGVFAKNYDVPFVPVPVYEPMGSVLGGLMIFSEFPPSEAIRYAYPLIANWPDKLFLLDRCFIQNRYPLQNGKDLLVINTHNSAYVYDSALRVHELQILKKVMLAEYDKGNFVVAGGDWNQNPPGYRPGGSYNGHKFFKSEVQMNPDFMPAGWNWAYDNSAPTNRQNYQAYVKGENGTTCLDYYLTSPNVEILESRVIDLNFENSDHNPVFLKIILND
ncbi:MAG: hypothetical protein L3J66_12900 [Bacteroidales bacterium]|nr:hypothetical protein [Bacteroidales bacterium]